MNLKLVLIAVLLIISCVATQAQGEDKENEALNLAEKPQYERSVAEDEANVARNVQEVRAGSPCRPPPQGGATTGTKSASSSSASASTTGSKSATTGSKSSTTGSKSASSSTTGSKSASTSTTGSKSASTSTTGSKSASTSTTGTQASTTGKSSSSGGANVGLCDLVPTSSEPLKLLVPLYVYPGAAWDQVVAAASKVKIIAIINPNSGPTSTPDSSYVNYMNRLKNAGVEMIGYVYTSYGARAISAVKADVDTYATKWPLLTGIFFDEVANDAGQIPFYTQAYNHVMSKGYVHEILNPGVQPAQGYLAISTSIVIFEDYGNTLSSKSYSSWVTCAPSAAAKSGYKYKFAGIAHTASSSASPGIISSMQSKGMGLVYVTDGAGGCCTYNNLVSYFAAEATNVQSLNS